MRKPLAVLAACHDRLAEGGILVLETGNYQCGDRLVSGKRRGLYRFDDMFYFTLRSLESLVRRAGCRDSQLHGLPAAPVPEPLTKFSFASKAVGILLHPHRSRVSLQRKLAI